jgi:hypothetical protein
MGLLGAPKTYQPKFKGKKLPKEHLAYISKQEANMLRQMTDGKSNMTRHGIPSFSWEDSHPESNYGSNVNSQGMSNSSGAPNNSSAGQQGNFGNSGTVGQQLGLSKNGAMPNGGLNLPVANRPAIKSIKIPGKPITKQVFHPYPVAPPVAPMIPGTTLSMQQLDQALSAPKPYDPLSSIQAPTGYYKTVTVPGTTQTMQQVDQNLSAPAISNNALNIAKSYQVPGSGNNDFRNSPVQNPQSAPGKSDLGGNTYNGLGQNPIQDFSPTIDYPSFDLYSAPYGNVLSDPTIGHLFQKSPSAYDIKRSPFGKTISTESVPDIPQVPTVQTDINKTPSGYPPAVAPPYNMLNPSDQFPIGRTGPTYGKSIYSPTPSYVGSPITSGPPADPSLDKIKGSYNPNILQRDPQGNPIGGPETPRIDPTGAAPEVQNPIVKTLGKIWDNSVPGKAVHGIQNVYNYLNKPAVDTGPSAKTEGHPGYQSLHNAFSDFLKSREGGSGTGYAVGGNQARDMASGSFNGGQNVSRSGRGNGGGGTVTPPVVPPVIPPTTQGPQGTPWYYPQYSQTWAPQLPTGIGGYWKDPTPLNGADTPTTTKGGKGKGIKNTKKNPVIDLTNVPLVSRKKKKGKVIT